MSVTDEICYRVTQYVVRFASYVSTFTIRILRIEGKLKFNEIIDFIGELNLLC